MAANYQIGPSNHGANQRQMIAIRILRPGDEIIAEAPIEGLLVALSRTYVEDKVLSATHSSSARDDMATLFDGWPLQKRQAFNMLHNKGNTIVDRWATNAFGISLPSANGLDYHNLFIFDNISRANHSCQPNAVWDWDPQRNLGTLHALRTIQQFDEIVINYLTTAEITLKNGANRNTVYQKHWGFRCTCAACNNNPADNTARIRAKRLYNQFEGEIANEGRANRLLRKMTAGDRYITELDTLGIRDYIIANAYDRTAELHEEASDRAGQQYHPLQGCATCTAQPNVDQRKIAHMEIAVSAKTNASTIHVRCSGDQHPVVTADDVEIRRLRKKLDQLQA